MKKTVIAAIAVVVVAGGSAMAYSAYARHDGWGHGRMHFGRMSPDDRAAYADARIAALKAGLRLSAEQENSGPPSRRRSRTSPPSASSARKSAAPNAVNAARHGATSARAAKSAAPSVSSAPIPSSACARAPTA